MMPKKKLLIAYTELIVCSLFILLFTTNYSLPTIYAQTTNCSTSASNTTSRADYLVTAGGSVDSKFSIFTGTNTNGACINGGGASTTFNTTLVDTYASLKDKYFTKKSGGSIMNGGADPDSPTNINVTRGVRYQTLGNTTSGNLIIGGVTETGSGTGGVLVFVDGNLTINGNINYGDNDPTRGIIFIVSGNVNIKYSPGLVTQVNAFIITFGQVCTAAGSGGACAASTVDVGSTGTLKVNGSIISMCSTPVCTGSGPGTGPFLFRRSLGLTNSSLAAEQFNFQTKYYILFKDFLSSSRYFWKEVAGVPTFPSPVASSTPIATPTPTPTPLPAETPVQTGIAGTKFGPTPWNTNSMGFRFTPNASGQITKLWSYTVSGTIRTVKLYTDSSALITSASITGNGAWASGNITPVNVTAGTPYKVVVYPTSNGYHIPFLTLPTTIGNITINSGGWVSADSGNITTESNVIYGLVDITFVPN